MLEAPWCVISALVFAITLAPTLAQCDDGPPFTDATSSLYVGCTLGYNWSGLQAHMVPDYTNTGQYERLDVTLPLYVTWILDPNVGTEGVRVNPPQPITNYAWFSGHHAEFQTKMAEVGETALYTDCPEGTDLEAPSLDSYPLNSSGELHIKDVHGGAAGRTEIRLRRFTNDLHTQGILLIAGWASPGTREDAPSGVSTNYSPDAVWTTAYNFGVNNVQYHAYHDYKIVEWVSPDIAPTSPGYVDASDLSGFVGAWDSVHGAVRWGFNNENPPSSPTYKWDVANLGGSQHVIDSSDLSALCGDLGKYCGMAKAGVDEDPAVIIAWFGLTMTGRMVVVGANGETVPEYALTDRKQMAVGVSNPYGYRDHIDTSRPASWGNVKQLFR
jgi:hypothetical protein